MKNVLLFFTFILCVGLNDSYAQLQKGNLLIGGDVGFNIEFVDDGDNPFTILANPSILGLVTDHIAIGGVLGFGYSRTSSNFSSTAFSILPAVRFYIPGNNENLAFFFDVQAGVTISSFDFGVLSDSDTAFTFGGGPGISFFISDDVSIDTGLAYNRIGGGIEQSILIFNVGLQVFINRGNKEDQ